MIPIPISEAAIVEPPLTEAVVVVVNVAEASSR